jgi:hypothetical protein
MRTDDGETWTTVYEDHGGEPDKNTARPVDFVTRLAYNPQRPDDQCILGARPSWPLR